MEGQVANHLRPLLAAMVVLAEAVRDRMVWMPPPAAVRPVVEPVPWVLRGVMRASDAVVFLVRPAVRLYWISAATVVRVNPVAASVPEASPQVAVVVAVG